MKKKSSLKKRCEYCECVKRKGRNRIICKKHSKHKQTQ